MTEGLNYEYNDKGRPRVCDANSKETPTSPFEFIDNKIPDELLEAYRQELAKENEAYVLSKNEIREFLPDPELVDRLLMINLVIDSSRDTLSRLSGIIYDDKTIITTKHVLANVVRDGGDDFERIIIFGDGDTVLEVKAVNFNPLGDSDIGIITMNESLGGFSKIDVEEWTDKLGDIITLGSTSDAQQGEEKVVSVDFFSGEETRIDDVNKGRIITKGFAEPGDSGGPAISMSSGKLVGITKMIYCDSGETVIERISGITAFLAYLKMKREILDK